MIISILKIIGIILLVILAIILLLLGIILLVPIRYRFEGEYNEKLNGTARVVWIPVLLKAVANVQDNELHYYVRLLGGFVMTNGDEPISWLGRKIFSEGEESEDSNKEKTKKKNKNHGDVRNMKGKNDLEDSPRKNVEHSIIEEVEQLEEQETYAEQKSQLNDTTIETLTHEGIDSNSSKEKKRKQSLGEKIDDLKKKINRLLDNLKKINKKKEALLKVYHSPRFGQAKKDVIKYIKSAFKLLKPDKLSGYVRFGTGDPASTGELFGALAVAIPLYYNFLILEPVFEDKTLYAKLDGKGKIRLISIVILLIKVALNKNLIKVVKRVQTIINA